MFAASDAGAYEADAWPVATCGGGFAVPNRTSYEVAPEPLHVSVGVALTPVAPFVGDGAVGVPGAEVGGVLPVFTDTLSNVEVFTAPRVMAAHQRGPGSRTRPSTLSSLPTVVHVEPFDDTDPVTVLPERASFNQAGSAWVAPPRYASQPPAGRSRHELDRAVGPHVEDDVRGTRPRATRGASRQPSRR